jgi:hypothetical protein
MKEFEHVQKNFRSEENGREVMIAPRNMLTNPPKAGIVGPKTTFGGVIPYMEDNYNRPREIATEERLHGQTLMQEKPFSQRAKQTHVFNKDMNVIGEDREYKHRPSPVKPKPPMEHDKAFKPSHPGRAGYNKCLSPFPEYIPDPKKPLERKVPVEGEDE